MHFQKVSGLKQMLTGSEHFRTLLSETRSFYNTTDKYIELPEYMSIDRSIPCEAHLSLKHLPP